MDTDSFEFEATYPTLAPAGATVVTVADSSAGVHAGVITIDGGIVAMADADGVHTPIDSCR